MIVEVDQASPVPAYEQLRSQVTAMLVAGTLEPGTRLPAIRRLAADLDLAPGTVARAYRELEAAGLVETNGRRGTRVTPRASWRVGDEVDVAEQLAEAAERYATVVAQLGVDPATARRALDDALAVTASSG